MVEAILTLLASLDVSLLFVFAGLVLAGVVGFSFDQLGYHNLASCVAVGIFLVVFISLFWLKLSWKSGHRPADKSLGHSDDPHQR